MSRPELQAKISAATEYSLVDRPNLMLELDFTHVSDPGKVRDNNEDYLGFVVPASEAEARSRGWCFALADGVGGHAQGEVASRVAVESVLAGFAKASAGDLHSSLLPRLVQAANGQVYESGLDSRTGGAAMATTLVACALKFDRAVIAHVGDSRCYLIRRGAISQVTRDHTLASEQVSLGVISPEEAKDVPGRHVLSRSLGAGMFVAVDTNVLQLMAGDLLLLCSDGLHGAVADSQIVSIIQTNSKLQDAVRQLVQLANEQDGSDNVSAVLVRVCSVERVGMYRGRPYRLG